MSALIGIVFVGIFTWLVWVGYVRALASKRYTSRQRVAPHLDRFAENPEQHV
jgi:hypothetical protein